MVDSTPAPNKDRAIYGFIFFILFKTLMFLYFLWAFIPEYIFEDYLKFPYTLDKYFALFVPVLIMFGIMVFGFLLYPSWNMTLTSNIDSLSTLRDKYSIKRCKFPIDQVKLCNRKIEINSINDNSWYDKKFCDSVNHENPIVTMNICDCLNESKCWLKRSLSSSSSSSSTAEALNYNFNSDTRHAIPNVCDLDISDVCQQIFN